MHQPVFTFRGVTLSIGTFRPLGTHLLPNLALVVVDGFGNEVELRVQFWNWAGYIQLQPA